MRRSPSGNVSRFWEKRPHDAPESANIERVDRILGSVVHLPLRYWKPSMFFAGAGDTDLAGLTAGRFPETPRRNGTHPVFSLAALPSGVGFQVCPCSSKRPFKTKEYRYISKECELLYTRHRMDRDSFLIEAVRFNIPESVAWRVRFKGLVPDRCVKRVVSE